jgi:hypothetical protein
VTQAAHQWDPRSKENLTPTRHSQSASNWSGPRISGQGIMASGACEPHRQVEDMAATRRCSNAPELELANGAPSRQGRHPTARL